MSSLGGFFVNLGLVVDEKSFSRGEQAIGNVTKSIGKIAGVSSLGVAGLTALGVAAGKSANEELRLSRAIGVSAQTLDKWKAAAGTAGVSGNALLAGMNQLETKMQRMKTGNVDMNLARSMGMLGLSYGDMSRMNADQRMRAVFGAASGMKDQGLASQLVGDTLGDAAKQYYDYLQVSGKSLDSQLKDAQGLLFTTDAMRKKAVGFNAEVNMLGTFVKNLGSFIGTNIAGAMTPVVHAVREILEKNKELIASGITGLVSGIGNALVNALPAFLRITKGVGNLIKKMGGLDRMIVRIGIGFAAIKTFKFASGLFDVAKGLGGITGMLKSGGIIALLAMLYLVIDDIVGYMNGKNSVFGMIKDAMSDILPADKIEAFKKALGPLKTLFNAIKDSSGELSKIWKDFFSASMTRLIDGFTDSVRLLGETIQYFVHLKSAFDEGGVIGAAKFMAQHEKEAWTRDAALTKAAYNAEIANGATKAQAIDRAGAVFIQNMPGLLGFGGRRLFDAAGGLNDAGRALLRSNESIFKSYLEEEQKTNGTVNDGIISPSGKITQVAPDDWVIAARDLGNVAAAFAPHGLNAPQNYSITQNFTVNGARDSGSTIKNMAYRGASDALGQAMSENARRLQMMSGTR